MTDLQQSSDWQLHLDRKSDRCMLRRIGDELPLIGTYHIERTIGQQIVRLRFPEPAAAPARQQQPTGAV